jgi:hypothetical protein
MYLAHGAMQNEVTPYLAYPFTWVRCHTAIAAALEREKL